MHLKVLLNNIHLFEETKSLNSSNEREVLECSPTNPKYLGNLDHCGFMCRFFIIFNNSQYSIVSK